MMHCDPPTPCRRQPFLPFRAGSRVTPLLETGARIGTIKPHAGMGLERTRNRFTAFLDDMAPILHLYG